jgi:hypothetical protein
LLTSLVTLAPAPAGVPARVDIDVSGLEQHMDDEALHRFHGDLLMRLLEAGHGVGNDGGVLLSLRSAGDAVVVECRVEGQLERVRVDDADTAILGLELVHRAVELVERCASTTGDPVGSAEGIYVAAETLSELDRSNLLVELADESVTLVAAEDIAAWRACWTVDGAAIVAIERSCEDAPALDSNFHAAIERWRTPARPTPSPVAELEAAIEVPESAPSRPPDPPPPPSSWGASVGVAAGVQLRFPGVGATLRADVAAVHTSGVFVGALGLLAPSRADPLNVIDGLALVGAGWRRAVNHRLVLRPSVALGLAVHRSAFPGEDIDHRVDFALRIPFELELRIGTRTYLSFALAGTLSSQRLEHRINDRVIWARSPIRLEALFGARFDWIR